MTEGRVVDEYAQLLGDRDRTMSTPEFLARAREFDEPGLYSWWADTQGLGDLRAVLGDMVANPIYAGQAGATKWPSGTRGRATLASRITTNHLRGNVGSSTFRRTLAAVLRERLGLELADGNYLARDSNRALSGWIREHLRLAVVVVADRDHLRVAESQMLATLDPPLNLQGMSDTDLRHRLRELCAALTAG